MHKGDTDDFYAHVGADYFQTISHKFDAWI